MKVSELIMLLQAIPQDAEVLQLGGNMKVIVYFERGMASHVVAIFGSEEMYMSCLPVLEAEAVKGGYIVTESCREDEEIQE